MNSTIHKRTVFKIGDRIQIIGKLLLNVNYKGRYATITNLNLTTSEYTLLFDNGDYITWKYENDMKYVGHFKVFPGDILKHKKDKSLWYVTRIDEHYHIHGECIKTGLSYQLGAIGQTSQIENYIINSTTTTIMNKLSIMMKKLLDKDTQILVKAGFIDGDLDLTEEGILALNSILFIEKKTEFVKMAEEIIAEQEKK